MQQEDKGLLFIKHYSHLTRLSVDLLKAIKEETLEIATDLVAQKQIIIDRIAILQGEVDINECPGEVKERLRALFDQIAVSEEESRQILKDNCSGLSKKMLAGRKELTIQQAYESRSFQENGNMLNIEK